MLPIRLALACPLWLALLTIGADAAMGGQLLVASFFTDRVGRYDAGSGEYLGMLNGNGLDGPLAARIGPDDLLYVTSEGSNQVQRYNWRTGEFVDNFVTGGLGGLDGPTGLDWDASGDLYVASFNSNTVIKYDGATGQFLGVPVPPGQNGLNGPDNGTIFGPDGKLYVPSYFSNRILRYDPATNTSEVFISGIGRPRVLVFQDNQWFITSETADAVKRYDVNGAFVDDFIRPGQTILDTPIGLEFFDDAWFVTSLTRDKVLKFDRNGQLLDANFIASGSGGIDGPTFITAIVPEPAASAMFVTILAMGLVLWMRPS